MRSQGWPFPNNPPILNQPNSANSVTSPDDPTIINLGERFNDGIVYRAEASLGGAIVGQAVFPGQQLKIILQGLGLPRKDSYGVILQVYQSAVKVFRQDGSIDIFSRFDPKVQSGVFDYSAGDPVWFELFAATPRIGVILNITRKANTEEIISFTVRADDNGQVLEVPLTAAVIKRTLPEAKPQFQSNYNVVSVDNLPKPGLVLPDQKP